jgi:Mn2+/Fe2+ NRAMP family transporter
MAGLSVLPIEMAITKEGSRSYRGVLLGAASLMATSAIGPGFLTQTAVFTDQFQASFGFAILLSFMIGIAAQVNIWRIIGVSGLRGQQVADRVLPGLGVFIAGLVCLGGLAFNTGNIAGAGLGLNAAIGMSVKWGALLSAVLGILVFLSKEAGRFMDILAKALGAVMIALTAYVAWTTHPPVGQAVLRTFKPNSFSLFPVITLVGGTVGGYITFSGAHRLLDAGICGKRRLSEISRSSVMGILIATVMRLLLFLAILGVVAKGFTLDPANPPASAFRAGAGEYGYRVFGIILWCAAITSIVGSAYTSVSFIRSFRPVLERKQSGLIIAFIAISTATFLAAGQPVRLLILAGALNGLILPVTLGATLLAAGRVDIIADYRHPRWLLCAGYLAIAAGLVAGFYSLQGIAELWR